jgi:hypothetical protein
MALSKAQVKRAAATKAAAATTAANKELAAKAAKPKQAAKRGHGEHIEDELQAAMKTVEDLKAKKAAAAKKVSQVSQESQVKPKKKETAAALFKRLQEAKAKDKANAEADEVSDSPSESEDSSASSDSEEEVEPRRRKAPRRAESSKDARSAAAAERSRDDADAADRRLKSRRHRGKHKRAAAAEEEDSFSSGEDSAFGGLYDSDDQRSKAQRESQKRRFRDFSPNPHIAHAQVSAEMSAHQIEIKKHSDRLQLAEAAQQRSDERRFGRDSLKGKTVWSVGDGSSPEASESESDDEGVGLDSRDEGDLDPSKHPHRAAVTDASVSHEEAARLNGQTLYNNFGVKLRVQGVLEQEKVLKRAIVVQKLNLKLLKNALKGSSKDLKVAITSLTHEQEHLKKAMTVLKGNVQACAIADDCSRPDEALQLIQKRWALVGNKPSKYMDVIADVHKSHAYANILSTARNGGGKGGGGGGGGGSSAAIVTPTSKASPAKGAGKGGGKGRGGKKGRGGGGGQVSADT